MLDSGTTGSEFFSETLLAVASADAADFSEEEAPAKALPSKNNNDMSKADNPRGRVNLLRMDL